MYAVDEQMYFRKEGIFYLATALAVVAEPKGGVVVQWLMPSAAVDALSQASHRWAVQRVYPKSRISSDN